MKVLLFGSYDIHQNHNITKIEGLKKVGVELIECKTKFPVFKRSEKRSYSFANFIEAAVKQAFNYIVLSARFFSSKNFDAMLVLYPSQLEMPLAKLLAKFKGKKVLFAPFISTYMTLTVQRKYFPKSSIRGKTFYLIDKYSCKLADKIIIDTNAHINYFSKTFNIPKNRFQRVFVGASKEFKPLKSKKNKEFTVLFYGSFIPGQGINLILDSAKLLEKEKIRFEIVGNGPLLEKTKQKVKEKNLENVTFIGRVDRKKLTEIIAKADVGLGIVESNPKTDLVVSNKAYELLAMKKPLINYNSAGIRELVKNTESVLFCEDNAKSIAKQIIKLKNDKKLREKIAQNGYSKFKQKASIETIGKEMKEVTKQVLSQ